MNRKLCFVVAGTLLASLSGCGQQETPRKELPVLAPPPPTSATAPPAPVPPVEPAPTPSAAAAAKPGQYATPQSLAAYSAKLQAWSLASSYVPKSLAEMKLCVGCPLPPPPPAGRRLAYDASQLTVWLE